MEAIKKEPLEVVEEPVEPLVHLRLGQLCLEDGLYSSPGTVKQESEVSSSSAIKKEIILYKDPAEKMKNAKEPLENLDPFDVKAEYVCESVDVSAAMGNLKEASELSSRSPIKEDMMLYEDPAEKLQNTKEPLENLDPFDVKAEYVCESVDISAAMGNLKEESELSSRSPIKEDMMLYEDPAEKLQNTVQPLKNLTPFLSKEDLVHENECDSSAAVKAKQQSSVTASDSPTRRPVTSEPSPVLQESQLDEHQDLWPSDATVMKECFVLLEDLSQARISASLQRLPFKKKPLEVVVPFVEEAVEPLVHGS